MASSAQNSNTTPVLEVPLRDGPRQYPFNPPPGVTRPAPNTYTAGNNFGLDAALIGRILERGKSRDPIPKYPGRDEFQTADNEVLTNHFELSIDPKTTFYEYQVTEIPPGNKAKKSRFMDTAIQNVTFLSQNQNHFATDNVSTIVSWRNLHSRATGPLHVHGAGPNGEGSEWGLINVNDDVQVHKLRFRFVRIVDIQGLQDYTNVNANANFAAFNSGVVLNALNVVISKCFQGNIIRFAGNKFFVAGSSRGLPSSNATSTLYTLRGYSYTVKAGMGKTLLNVNSATSAFWRPQLLSRALQNGDIPIHRFQGLRVYIRYDRGRNAESRNSSINDYHSRIKPIFAFGKKASSEMFDYQAPGSTSSREISVVQYFEQTYSQNVVYPNLEAVNLGTVLNPSWFLPEKLFIMPWQVYRKVVPNQLVSFMHDEGCRKPMLNRSLIESEALGGHFHVNPTLNPPQSTICPAISIDQNMLQVPCVRLNYPTVRYYQGTANADQNTGRWDLRGRKFHSHEQTRGRQMNVVFLNAGNRRESRRDYPRDFERQMVTYGVLNNNPTSRVINLHDTTGDSLKREIERCKNEYKCDLVILILPGPNQDVYSDFKQIADRVIQIHSICLTENANIMRDKTWKNENQRAQYFANVAMKANLKLGGVNHAIASDTISQILDDTLILGADTTHPGPGAVPHSPSIAAVVGSVGNTGGKFLGTVDIQPKQEIIIRFDKYVLERLKDWAEIGKNDKSKFPARVLYYRDGVGESQYDDVKSHEVDAIKDAFQQRAEQLGLKKAPSFQVTAVIVTKRHSTRFYPTDEANSMRGNNNCKPGTLVDSGITSPCHNDFFLQSHNGIKGTAKGAHYFVLENGMGLSSATLQELTNNLCHTYVRATVGVSYASPAYYADRLCERGRCYFRRFFSPPSQWRDDAIRQRKGHTIRVKMERDFRRGGPRRPRRPGQAKSVQEIEEDREDRLKIEERMLTTSWEQAITAWRRIVHDTGNPLLKTMYWM